MTKPIESGVGLGPFSPGEIAALKALAEEVDERHGAGWTATEHWVDADKCPLGAKGIMEMEDPQDYLTARYVAACSPGPVLRLIAQLKGAEDDLRRWLEINNASYEASRAAGDLQEEIEHELHLLDAASIAAPGVTVNRKIAGAMVTAHLVPYGQAASPRTQYTVDGRKVRITKVVSTLQSLELKRRIDADR